MSKKSTNYSPTMLAHMDKHGIKPEAVRYLTIQRVHLDRIVRGEKTVEFRDATDFYIKKFCEIEDGEAVSLKPHTHILFQAGYSPTSPRALVQFQDIGIKDESQRSPLTDMGKRMFREAKVEGFSLDDSWLGIALGQVECAENM